MKKRTAFIGAILSLITIGQPLIIKTGFVLSITGLMLSLPETANAESNDFYFDRAFEKGENDDYYGAISDYNKALEIDPNDFQAYYNRGWNKGKLKDYYGEISDYTKAIEINPKLILGFSNRSIAKEDIGDIKGACKDARKAVSLGDNNLKNQNWIKKNC